MDEAVAGVAPQLPVGPFGQGGKAGGGRKRSFAYSNQQLEGYDARGSWNPDAWKWDTSEFLARPLVQSKANETQSQVPSTSATLNGPFTDEEDGGGLKLQLGGGSGGGGGLSDPSSSSPSLSQPNKKRRSTSPTIAGGGARTTHHHPTCQVDVCRGDLSESKDYYRRHKVCEVHSKANKALVANQMQRFCQQCSRFHPLSEFDDGKRSCRRRLDGHNRRRRKTQAEDTTSIVSHPSGLDNATNDNLNLISLLTALAQQQGKMNSSSVSKNDAATMSTLFASSCNLLAKKSPEQSTLVEKGASSKSTKDLLPVLSATLKTSTSDTLGLVSYAIGSDGGTKSSSPKLYSSKSQRQECQQFLGEKSSASHEIPNEESVQDAHLTTALQLFNSSSIEEGTNGNPDSNTDSSSNPSANERSPSCPPIIHKLFPMQTTKENTKLDHVAFVGGPSPSNGASTAGDQKHSSGVALKLFSLNNEGTDKSLMQKSTYTSCGSDHSPPSFNSYPQDRTGRILFKLFDRDPSCLPSSLRSQIYEWLSNSPSEMESYIRPGCVVLSVYLSMPTAAWDQLEANLVGRVSALINISASEFWRNGRFLVQVGRRLVSYRDGKVHRCKQWRSLRYPELHSVSPLAVVGGEETSLILRGRNLCSSGIRIHCAYMGGYISRHALGSTSSGTERDQISLGGLKFHATATDHNLGRFYVEVENGLRRNSFPVIIADSNICQELRVLESEFDEMEEVQHSLSVDGNACGRTCGSREEVLHFLNELGWLFQRNVSPEFHVHDNRLYHFQFLLTFSVERDCCTLVKTLLDIFVERLSLCNGISRELHDRFQNFHLLNRAVKRKCRTMVDLLVHYYVTCNDSNLRKYIFPPNVSGAGGITPLHLAASMSGSYDIVDALTSDPQEIGLHCWESLLDDNEESPASYALMRNNHSYNSLVRKKLAEKRSGQISVSIENELQESAIVVEKKQSNLDKLGKASCGKCTCRNFGGRSLSTRSPSPLFRPYINLILVVAAVCVCVCLFDRSAPDIGSVDPFRWANLGYGTM